MATSDIHIGIVSVGTYIPEPFETSAQIAEASGIPEWVIRDKFGIHKKHVASPNDHTNQMAIWDGKGCLSKCDIPPDEIDVVLCTTEEWKEYLLWTAGIKIHRSTDPASHQASALGQYSHGWGWSPAYTCGGRDANRSRGAVVPG